MAKRAIARPESPRTKTPAERTVAQIGWLLALIAVIGLITKPATPWLFLWVPLLTFAIAKAPQDLRDAWRRRQVARRQAP
jgi:fatty acid desaturase